MGLCPFHQEKTPSFTVRPDEGFFKCFGCGKGGDVFSFVQEVTGRSFPEVLEELADKAGVTLPKRQQMSEADQARFKAQRERFDVMSQTQKFYQTLLWSPKGQRGLRYLIETRKLPKKIIETFGLGYGGHFGDPPLVRYFEQEKIQNELGVTLGVLRQGEKGLFGMYENRITFPICDTHGRIVGFGGRNIESSQKRAPKYINSPETPLYKKTEHLFNVHRVLPELKKGAPAILVEGYLDVVALHQAGCPTAVAPCGTQLTVAQVKLLRRYTDQVILCMDADAAGQEAAQKALSLFLREGFGVRWAHLAQKDPDALVQAGQQDVLVEAIQKAPDAILSWCDRHVGEAMSNPAQKVKIMDTALAWVAAIPRELVRRQYLNQMAELFGEQANILEDELNRVAGRKSARRPTPAPEPMSREARPSNQPVLAANVPWSFDEQNLARALISHPLLVPYCNSFVDEVRNPNLKRFIEQLSEFIVENHKEEPQEVLRRMPQSLFDAVLLRLVLDQHRFEGFMSDDEALDIIRGWMERADMAPSLRKQSELYQKLKAAQEIGDQRQILHLVGIIDEGVRRLKEKKQLKHRQKKSDEGSGDASAAQPQAESKTPVDPDPAPTESAQEELQGAGIEEESDWWVEDESWS